MYSNNRGYHKSMDTKRRQNYISLTICFTAESVNFAAWAENRKTLYLKASS